MRTATFLGLIILAKAVDRETVVNMSTGISIILLIMMIMDIFDFVKKISK